MQFLIYVSDYETSKILFANNAKKELFGKNILGKLCYNVFHGKDAPCELCHKKDLLRKNNELVRSENYYPTVQKYFYNVDKLINWHDGQVAKFQISFDLTEIKRIEQQIRKLSIAVEQNPATIVITDRTYRLHLGGGKGAKPAHFKIGQNKRCHL